MFNKKRKEVDPHANKIDFFISQIKNARFSLESAIRTILRKQDAIDVYPSGIDKDRAQKELDTAREKLLSKIAQYDDYRAQYFEYLRKNNLPLYAYYPAPGDSHSLIEIFVYNYKRKGA